MEAAGPTTTGARYMEKGEGERQPQPWKVVS